MFELTSKGDFNKLRSFLNEAGRGIIFDDFNYYGQLGVDALSRATPVDTGRTASSWKYRVIRDRKGPSIEWYNTNDAGGKPVAILLQYGHGTGTGGYVQGRDYINPAIQPIFDRIAADVWKRVTA